MKQYIISEELLRETIGGLKTYSSYAYGYTIQKLEALQPMKELEEIEPIKQETGSGLTYSQVWDFLHHHQT